eukprot:gene26259-31724_t
MFSAKAVVRLVPKIAQRGFAAAAAEAAGPSAQLVLNFTTPHQPLYNKKVVDQVILPGSAGEYGVTANHSPVISELRPGVVTVIHVGGAQEKFFVSGGFALTRDNSVTDVSVPEAVPLSDIDEAAVKAAHADATRRAGD